MIGRLPGMALGACLFVSVEAVSADLYWCDRCTPEQEKTMLARIDHGRTWSEVYVGDPSTRSLHKYGVARSWGQAVPYDVRRKGTEPEIESAFAQLLRFHDAAPAGWKKTYTLRIVDAARDASDYFNRQAIPVFDYPDPAVSVYDVLGDVRQRRFFEGYVQADILRRIPLDLGITRRSLAYLHTVDDARSPTVSVRVQFMDGSRVVARLEIADGLMVKIDERSARDARDRAISALPRPGGSAPRMCRAPASSETEFGRWHRSHRPMAGTVSGVDG
ncbi:hypothetical protein ABZR86_01290 [Dyella marensis]|jgi:hypothetical protein|uniref:Uncharacterized protein n=1 Tax=Dyella marensis TaxID=500610 RepID=A0A1I2APZ2_9GAMM|nr:MULTISPECIES: hypothetical protein [Dyella]SFE46031.1 hypothetical protein SAMN02799615_01108 [Dyella marensis]